MDQDSRSAAVGRKKRKLNNHTVAPPPPPSDAESSSLDDGEIQSDTDPDTRSESADHHSVGEEPPNSTYQTTDPSQIKLKDLSKEEQLKQKKFWDVTDPEELVRCMSCAAEGHMFATCPDRTCKYCGAYDKHWHGFCPTTVRCPRCKNLGHAADSCTQPGGPITDPCRCCDMLGHVEKECPNLGVLKNYAPRRKGPVKRRHMIVGCYNCGSNQHWGDDCPTMSAEKRARIPANSPWSAKAAAPFVAMMNRESQEKNEPAPPTKNWQTSKFDDTRD